MKSIRPTSFRLLILSIAALIASSSLATACSFTDVFNTGSDDNSVPSATATPTAAESGSREAPYLGHRFYFSPPQGAYDPNLPVASPEQRLLDTAAERWSDTDTVHFVLNVDGATYLDVNESIELQSVEGDLKRPDRAQAEADVKIGFASFDVGLIVIGDDAYMTNFLTGNWESAPSDFDFNPVLLFDDERGVSAVLESLRDVESGGEDEIGGTRAVEITGTVDRADIAQLVGGSLEGDEIGISLWMNAETGDLLRIGLSEPDDVDGDPTTWIIAFTRHNEPVSISAPD